jgi:hypothetical protein
MNAPNIAFILRSAPSWARVSKDRHTHSSPSFETPRKRAAPQDDGKV